MDRGSNVGVEGSDARVIETHTDLKANIYVIENHEMNANPPGFFTELVNRVSPRKGSEHLIQ